MSHKNTTNNFNFLPHKKYLRGLYQIGRKAEISSQIFKSSVSEDFLDSTLLINDSLSTKRLWSSFFVTSVMEEGPITRCPKWLMRLVKVRCCFALPWSWSVCSWDINLSMNVNKNKKHIVMFIQLTKETHKVASAFRTIAHWIKIHVLLWFALMLSWSKIFTCCPMYVFKKFRYFLTNQSALFTCMKPIRSTEGSSTLVSAARDLSRAFYQFLTLIYLYTVEWFPFFDFYNFPRTMEHERFS